MIAEGSVPAVKLYMELCKDVSGGEREPESREIGAIRQLREAIFTDAPPSAEPGTEGCGVG